MGLTYHSYMQDMCLKNKENQDKNNIIRTSGSKCFQQRSAEEVYANDYNITAFYFVVCKLMFSQFLTFFLI